jgi:hypothetical protein
MTYLSELLIQGGKLAACFNLLIMGVRVSKVAEVEQNGRKLGGARLQSRWQGAAELEELS